MRFVLGLLIALVAAPVLAAGWSSYHNQRFGATADIPPGFTETGPEAANSDGLTFRNDHGALLVVFGAEVPGRDFEAYAESRYIHARDYDHWSNIAKTVTPDWAEISGSSGRQQMRLRIISACDGRHAVAVQYTAPAIDTGTWSHLKNSLAAGPATSC